MQNIQDALAVGTILQGEHYQYEIIEILGQGSFGITYKARLILKGSLGRISANETLVAIKEFYMNGVNGRAEGSNSISMGNTEGMFGDYMRKFRREAKNLSLLDHPNIIQVLEGFEANNTAYYVMEYIPGGSLDGKLKRIGRIPENTAVDYVIKIGAALSKMHSKSMMHLDLKPGNIMLKDDDTPVLIDFGLSKHFDENGVMESSTKIGGGTPGYSPLEQSNYQQTDGMPVTMDVYALGATMFKMLTGQRPPDASEILNEGFPADELRHAKVSEPLIAIIDKAMAPMKRNRYQSVDEFIKALQERPIMVDLEMEDNKSEENNDSSNIHRTDTSGNTSSASPDEEHTVIESNEDNENTMIAGQDDDEHTVIASGDDEHTVINDSEIDLSGYEEPRKKSTGKLIGIFIGSALLTAIVLFAIFSSTGDSKPDAADSSLIADSAVVFTSTVTDLQGKNAIGNYTYAGDVNEAGQPDGHGVAKFSNGNTYDGQWEAGKMSGECTYTLSNGDTFKGKFFQDYYNEGRYTIKSSGEYFEGTFKNGEPDKGSWYDKNGTKLEN